MATHKWMDRICIGAVVLSLLLTLLFMNGAALGIRASSSAMGYEDRLFDTSKVHTVDIVMDNWDIFIASCENEEYEVCTVVIDGERFSNVGLRAKGNTSLSSVSSMNSDRYSFKLEFDQYDSTKSYYGLDKLSLNNLIQDNTMMKDYLVYRMMGQMGVASPLCSFVYITVNGEDWGLYLAVEAIEESFLQRNYGSDYGDLYKPDSMSFGGGRGNGKDFSFSDWQNTDSEEANTGEENTFPGKMAGTQGDMSSPEDFDPSGLTGNGFGRGGQDMDFGSFGGTGNIGSADVKLQYIDDNASSYTNIFDHAKTDVTAADQTRLIESLQKLSAGEELEDTVDVEAVIRYFVVHTFVCNDDSYTGSMIHNYYLYEEDGTLSMLPWDYNLAFGGFQSGNASSAVNASIFSPVTGGDLSDRPMLAWIFDGGEYERMYYNAYKAFIDCYFNNDAMARWIAETAELIAPYIEKDPTKFCTYAEFETGVSALQQFMQLRSESVRGQLAGEDTLVDTGDLNLSDMGSMGQTMDNRMPQMGAEQFGGTDTQTQNTGPQMPSSSGQRNPGMTGGMQSPGMTGSGEIQPPNGMGIADGTEIPEGMELPEGMEVPNGMQMQGGMGNWNSETVQLPGMSGEAMPAGGNALQSGNSWLTVGISLLVLIIGLTVVAKYKR